MIKKEKLNDIEEKQTLSHEKSNSDVYLNQSIINY